MPRSLHSATRCTCGIDIGMQQQNAATASIANTTLGGQPSTVGRAACAEAGGGGTTSGGRFRTMIAIGTMTVTSSAANISMVFRQPYSPIVYSKIGGQIAPEMYWPLAIKASAEPRCRSNQRLT